MLDIVRSEEFRGTLTAHAPSALPNLVVQRPERYRRTTDRVSGNSLLVFEVQAPSDVDWLERAGFTREVEIERAFHAKYDSYMEKRSPARRAYFVFGKRASVRGTAVIQRITAEPSKVLAAIQRPVLT